MCFVYIVKLCYVVSVMELVSTPLPFALSFISTYCQLSGASVVGFIFRFHTFAQTDQDYYRNPLRVTIYSNHSTYTHARAHTHTPMDIHWIQIENECTAHNPMNVFRKGSKRQTNGYDTQALYVILSAPKRFCCRSERPVQR